MTNMKKIQHRKLNKKLKGNSDRYPQFPAVQYSHSSDSDELEFRESVIAKLLLCWFFHRQLLHFHNTPPPPPSSTGLPSFAAAVVAIKDACL